MSESALQRRNSLYRPHAEAPAIAQLRRVELGASGAGLLCDEFELISRGDLISGALYRDADGVQSPTPPTPPTPPASPTRPTPPAPLVLVVRGDGTPDPALPSLADFIRSHDRSWAVAMIDLPLHGTRQSPKLSERLFEDLRALSDPDAKPIGLDSHALVEEFLRQSLSDILRTLDALGDRPEIDPNRIALMGFEVGATLCAHILAIDSRARAAILGPDPLWIEDPAYDAVSAIRNQRGASSPESGAGPALLIVDREEASPHQADATERIFAGAQAPKERLSLPSRQSESGFTSAEIRDFLARHFE